MKLLNLSFLIVLFLLQACTPKKDITPLYHNLKENFAKEIEEIENSTEDVTEDEMEELISKAQKIYVDSLTYYIHQYPDEEFIADAWVEIFNTIWYEKDKASLELFNKAIHTLATKYADSKALEQLNEMTIIMDWIDPDIEILAESIIEKNTSDNINDRFTLAYADRLMHKENRTKVELDKSIHLFNALIDKYPNDNSEVVEAAKNFLRVFYDLAIGKKAPKTVSKDLNEKEVSLSDYRGKVVLIDVWATWCGPCIEMLPDFAKIRALYPSLEIISVSMDESIKDVNKFQEKTPMPWNHWFNGPEGGFLDLWGIIAFPTIIIIDKEGIIRHRFDGGTDHSSLEKSIGELI